jgi:hypothetical protein
MLRLIIGAPGREKGYGSNYPNAGSHSHAFVRSGEFLHVSSFTETGGVITALFHFQFFPKQQTKNGKNI